MGSWKDDYITGIELCDEQHKELFRILDECIELSRKSSYLDKSEEIIEVLERLISYTEYHFEEEEKHMLKIGYKKFLSHKVSHDSLINDLKNFDIKIEENQDEALKKVINLVLDWISNHILVTDKNILNNLK